MAFSRRNTKRNADDKQTMPISDPKKKLKPRGYLKQAINSTSKVYQPKPTQSNTKVLSEQLTLQEVSTQIHLGETSNDRVEDEIINPELGLPEIKTKTYSIASFTNKGKRPISIPALIDIPSVPKIKFPTSRSFEEYILHSDSIAIGSLVYISCKYEEPSHHLSFPQFLVFLSPNGESA